MRQRDEYGREIMKQQRSIAAKGRTAVLVCGLGAVGLLIPATAGARPIPGAWGSASGGHAGRETRPQGAQGRAARGKKRHHKKSGAGAVSEAAPRGKHRSRRSVEARQAKLACTDAFAKAKEAAQDDHLRSANEWFALCAEATCARSLRQRCTAVHGRIAALMPSVVPTVTDPDGTTSRDAEVKMDGEVLTSNLDGNPIVIDPGNHEFTFSRDGEVFAKRRLSIEKGQRRQIVSATFQPRKTEQQADPGPTEVVEERAPARAPRKVPTAVAVADSEPAAEEPEPRVVQRAPARRAGDPAEAQTGAPWSAYALGAVGVLGDGGYFTLNLKGSAENDALAAFCKPDCRPESVRKVRNIYLMADVSLGIGIAALAASTYLFFRSPDSPEEEDKSRSRSGGISGLSIEPTSRGAFATVGGTF
jgi:hypothetical protein